MDDIERIDGRVAFQQAVRAAFAEAALNGWRTLWLCDPDFANWPLGERTVVDSLTRWVGSQRRITVFALDYDDLTRRHPRWVNWRRQWAHVVHCRMLTDAVASDVPVVLHAPGALTLRLLDPVHCQGSVSRRAADATRADEQFDAITQRSVEAFPPTTLGL